MNRIFRKHIFISSLLITVLFFVLLWFFVYGYSIEVSPGRAIKINHTSFIFYGFLSLCFAYLLSFFVNNFFHKRALTSYNKSIKAIKNVIKSYPADKENILPEFSIIIRDLTELLETNVESIKQARHRQKNISQIMDQMQDGVVILNSTLNIIFINKKAGEIFNIAKPRRRHTFIQLYRNQQVTKALHRLKETNEAHVDIEYDKRTIRLELNLTEDGYIIFTKDVTEIRRVEQLQRDFSANVSHALKTPVTSIIGFAELINKGMITDPSKIIELSDKIYVNAQNLVTLIDDTMRLAYLESESVNKDETVEVKEIVQNSLDILSSKIEEKNIKVSLTGSGKANVKYAHMVELTTNLIENAIKYNNKNGSINIDIQQNNEKLTLVVADTGIGIQEEYQRRVLDRYYRVPSSIHGNGLGLSIVDTIVKLYGGFIKMDSKAGVGTTFTVII